MDRHSFFAMVTFLVSLLDMLLAGLVDYAFPSAAGGLNQILYWASSVLTNVVSYLILAGAMKIYLNLCRERRCSFSDLWFAFSNHPEPIAVYSVIQFILQTVLFTGGYWMLSILWLTTDQHRIVQLIVITVVVALVLLYLQLSLSMVLFLYCDAPYQSARELISESFRMMRGNRLRLLRLLLSFLGVMLLGVLSFGIGFLFARPYMYVTQALFYLELCSQQKGYESY
jgi:uncharacterized membrane protein